MRRASDFIFESVEELEYHLHKISLKRSKSHIESPKWLMNKGAAINPKKKDDKCFQCALTMALNYNEILKKI